MIVCVVEESNSGSESANVFFVNISKLPDSDQYKQSVIEAMKDKDGSYDVHYDICYSCGSQPTHYKNAITELPCRVEQLVHLYYD